MSVPDTPSDEPTAELDAVFAWLEHELRAHGRLAFETVEAARVDRRLEGFESCLALLGAAVFAPDPDGPLAARRHRIAACRLLLLALAAHTDAPRFTTLQLEQLVEAVIAIPGAQLGDIALALFALLGESRGECTPLQIALIDELDSLLVARNVRVDDYVWIALRVADPSLPVTAAQAYFARRAMRQAPWDDTVIAARR